MKTPEVLKELEEQMCPRGLDEKSKDRYVQILWEWMEGSDRMKAQTAARILGKGFIGEKLSLEEPEELRIVGYEEGLRLMLGEPPREAKSEEDATT